jgi:hypothetical protein
VNTAISWEEGEAVECVEVGPCKEVVERGPLKGASHALQLFGAEGHGRANSSIEEGCIIGGRVVLNRGEGARGDIFSNKVGGGFWESRGFFGSRRVDNESMVGEGRSEGSGFGVTVLGGEEGVGEDVIDIYVGEESGGVERVKN